VRKVKGFNLCQLVPGVAYVRQFLVSAGSTSAGAATVSSSNLEPARRVKRAADDARECSNAGCALCASWCFPLAFCLVSVFDCSVIYGCMRFTLTH
jgi:hypothetical protein